MRNLLCLLIISLSVSAFADSVILLYEPDTTREEIEPVLNSFGLSVVSYWGSVHGGLVHVPCREAERWVRVLNQVKGIFIAEHNAILTAASTSPISVLTCVPETESVYDEETETLTVPQLYLDGNVYRAKLTPPFNIQELEPLGQLDIYQYE